MGRMYRASKTVRLTEVHRALICDKLMGKHIRPDDEYVFERDEIIARMQIQSKDGGAPYAETIKRYRGE